MKVPIFIKPGDATLVRVVRELSDFCDEHDLEPWQVGPADAQAYLRIAFDRDTPASMALLKSDDFSREIYEVLEDAAFRGSIAIYSNDRCDWVPDDAFYVRPSRSRAQQYETFSAALEKGLARVLGDED